VPDYPELPAAIEPEDIAPATGPRIPRTDLLIALVLSIAAIMAYLPVRNADFVNFDDKYYVYDNPHIRGEFNAETVEWIFLSGYPDNWFPLTRISHLLDYKVFGPNATGHHIVNVFFHVLAGLLLFAFLRRATRSRWPSAAVAVLFLLHPLHVESVAWVSERKDVLCAVFWFATLLAWTRYAERPSKRRYLLALFLFALGLMSKPMIVTMPGILLLVDWWPLKRSLSLRLLWEKIPFAALAVGDAIVTYAVQHSVGAMASASELSISLRIENALMSVAIYIGKMFVPLGLGILYPLPERIPVWQPILVGIALCVVTGLVLRFRRYPWLAVGWFWYLLTLIPVIGIVQVGLQARADRYTYVPMIGMSILFAWTIAMLLRRWPGAVSWAAVAGVAASLALAAATWTQIRYWHDTHALFRRSIEVEPQNYVALGYLGLELSHDEATYPEAMSAYEAAIRIRPDFVQAYNGLGVVLFDMGLVPLAISKYRAAIRINADYPEAHYNLGHALLSLGRDSEAIPELQEAVQLNSWFAEAHSELGVALLRVPGRTAEAIDHLRRAVKINPERSVAQNNLGMVLARDPRQLGEAIQHLQKAIRVRPEYAEAWVNLGVALLRIPSRRREAIFTLKRALRLKPDEELRRQVERIEAAEERRNP
jgi:tetratricopeptide (TPR) repeat protein